MTLASSFPQAQREESFERQFVPGVLIRLFCSFTIPKKEKRLLIVDCGPPPFFFVINSEINQYKQEKSRLLAQQVLLEHAQYGCMDHNCYVDCSNLRDEFSYDHIKGRLTAEPDRFLGRINPATLAEILTVVDDSKTLEPREKETIISKLSLD